MSYGHRLSDGEKRELLRVARATLREFAATGRIPPGKPHTESLLTPAGAFVTLRHGEELRGCVGTQAEETPLYRTVQEMAVAAASRDPRFPPVTAPELDDLTIEISVLGERSPVVAPEEIVIGEHGLSVESAGRRGLLLPQVASDRGWDATTFLTQVCRKAGLPDDAWRDGTIERFSAQVFDEKTHPKRDGWF